MTAKKIVAALVLLLSGLLGCAAHEPAPKPKPPKPKPQDMKVKIAAWQLRHAAVCVCGNPLQQSRKMACHSLDGGGIEPARIVIQAQFQFVARRGDQCQAGDGKNRKASFCVAEEQTQSVLRRSHPRNPSGRNPSRILFFEYDQGVFP